jgi:hypothetical protein
MGFGAGGDRDAGNRGGNNPGESHNRKLPHENVLQLSQGYDAPETIRRC